MPTGTEEALIAAGITIVKKAVEEGWLERLRNAFKKRHRVLLLGSTGVGKTNLVDALTKDLAPAIDALNRTDYVKEHRISISKKPFMIVDPPGQIAHQSRRSTAIRKEIGKGPIGVISINAYGFHEYEPPVGDPLQNGLANPAYLSTHRDIELDFLSSWVDLLGHRTTTDWLVTVISKADLWWDHRSAVIEYYTTGPYYKALGPAQSLDPITLPFSSVTKKFFKEAPVSGSFDDSVKVVLKQRLLETLFRCVTRK